MTDLPKPITPNQFVFDFAAIMGAELIKTDGKITDAWSAYSSQSKPLRFTLGLETAEQAYRMMLAINQKPTDKEKMPLISASPALAETNQIVITVSSLDRLQLGDDDLPKNQQLNSFLHEMERYIDKTLDAFQKIKPRADQVEIVDLPERLSRLDSVHRSPGSNSR